MEPALLLLAAGMGSRYGGLKQLDPMGPSGQTMVDYAVVDAERAGFKKIVFVIRKDFEAAFREQIGRQYEARVDVHYAFQAIEDLPGGHRPPPGREKPWGTAHAVRAAREVIAEPFAVINADDYYGAAAYTRMAAFLRALPTDGAVHSAMVGYVLEKTLSPHGTVNRGICRIRDGLLQSVEEYTAIGIDADGVLRGVGLDGQRVPLATDAVVSMNFWGFSPSLFEPLETGFENFLAQRGSELKSEYYLPGLVDQMIQDGQANCPVLETDSPWFGVTYPEDKARVVERIAQLTAAGMYGPAV
ncbi:MAG: NDP-sugar synthase [Opitutales bacterium]